MLSATLVACLIALGSTVAFVSAQAPATGASTGGIAVVDVGRVYEGHVRFKNAMSKMKTDVQAAEAQLKADSDALRKMAEKGKDLKPGSQELRALEANFAKLQADFNVKASLQKKDFLDREAKIYNQVYDEVRDEVAKYGKSRGLSAVFRYTSAPIDSTNREGILQGINKPMVYVSPGLDVTDWVLAQLNGPSAAPGAISDRTVPANR